MAASANDRFAAGKFVQTPAWLFVARYRRQAAIDVGLGVPRRGSSEVDTIAVSAEAVKLFGILSRYANTEHEAFPSRATLAGHMGFARREGVDRALKELILVGAIAVETKPDRSSNLYRLCPHDAAPGCLPGAATSPEGCLPGASPVDYRARTGWLPGASQKEKENDKERESTASLVQLRPEEETAVVAKHARAHGQPAVDAELAQMRANAERFTWASELDKALTDRLRKHPRRPLAQSTPCPICEGKPWLWDDDNNRQKRCPDCWPTAATA